MQPWTETALLAGDPRESLNRWLAAFFGRLSREPACVRVQAALRAELASHGLVEGRDALVIA